MTGSPNLICPKCQGAMRSYERSGVMIDQCTECRGIYLDRGELERLIDAESGSRTQYGTGRDSAIEDGSERRGGDERERGYGREREHERDDDWDDHGKPGSPSDPRANQQPRRREGRFGGLMDIFGGD